MFNGCNLIPHYMMHYYPSQWIISSLVHGHDQRFFFIVYSLNQSVSDMDSKLWVALV